MLHDSPLGKNSIYVEHYAPELLYPILRSLARDKIALTDSLPFDGVDIWNGYEISWLLPSGKPQVAMAELRISATSSHLIESKSLKLYLNSFNQTVFDSLDSVEALLVKDLSAATSSAVEVDLFIPERLRGERLEDFTGRCLDDIPITTAIYQPTPELLKTGSRHVEETLYSHLLKSNCLATGQPDWGSLLIKYVGKAIDHEALLKYIISFRQHSGFAEHCVEQIFYDILTVCQPKLLTVYARYTRRGGLDINPFRSNFESAPVNSRHYRQ